MKQAKKRNLQILLLCMTVVIYCLVFSPAVEMSASGIQQNGNNISGNLANSIDTEAQKLYENLTVKLEAHSAYVMETGRQRVLYQESGDQRTAVPAASKLMTMLIACERLPLDTMVTISSVAASQKDALDSPDGVELETGDKYPLEYLLLRIAHYDSDAAAIAIAEQISNEESKFVELMNSRAESYGMADTYFLNSTGIPVYQIDNYSQDSFLAQLPLQYTTAADIARLMMAATQNQTFVSIFSQSSEYIVLDGQSVVPMRNEIEPLWTLSEGRLQGAFYSEYQGQSTIISTGKTNDIDLITVVINTSFSNRYNDTLNLYYAIDNHYMMSPLVKAGELYAENFERTVDGESFGLIYKKTVYYIHPKDDDFLNSNVQYRTYGPHSRPIQRSMIVGQVVFELKDGTNIAVDVGPDRQILSTITILDRALDQLQNNPNLTYLIIFSLLVLILIILWQTIRGVREVFHLFILIRLDKKSKRS